MRNRDRSFAARVGRGLLLAAGIVGGLALVDAVVLFFVFLMAAMVSDRPSPYIGIVFVGLPIIALTGVGVAAIAYAVLRKRAPRLPADRDHAHV
ncbi:MAG TPA: hypothetical protein VH436_29100 [Vicinamibacterales bacterium]|jgi:hypothetical protein